MLEDLINAVINRDGGGDGESTVVALHCQQMREWGTRGGKIEHRPMQDPSGQRLKFITKISKANNLSQRYDHVMDCFVCRGEILWFFMPDPNNPGNYLIEFFVGGLNNPDPQYKIYYNPGGRDIQKVIIRYSYDLDIPGVHLQYKQQKWVRIVITQNWIEQSESLTKPEFDWENLYAGSFMPAVDGYLPQPNIMPAFSGGASLSQPPQRYPNPFAPNLPVVVSANNARRLGQQGSDDFYWIQSLIESHEGLVQKAHKNLRMFANPILVTTRTAQEVMAKTQGFASANTWASANRYVDLSGGPYSGSTNTLDVPRWGMQRNPFGMISSLDSTEGELDTIFGGVGENERFAFIQANAVSGDQNLWIRQDRELIHWTLGGIDPLGLSSSATFGEIKTLFGRVENTADKKAHALYGHTGLGKVFELILWREEVLLFKPWLMQVLKKNYPQYFTTLLDPDQLTDEMCQSIWQMRQQGQIQLPHNPVGMLPGGDREVVWRYLRDVFQQTTREELDRSIAARNEREDGLSQEWVLRKQYPDMTDQEIQNAMSGFSPRVVENAVLGIQGTLQLFQQFMNIPDPQNPKVPWGIRLGVPDMLEQSMLTLKKELAYGQPVYEPSGDPPLTLGDIIAQIQQEGAQPNGILPLSNGDFASNPSGSDAVLASMGLPTTAQFRQSWIGAGNGSPELSGSIGAPQWSGSPSPETAILPSGSANLFGRQLPSPGNPSNWGAGTPLGTVGQLDPTILSLYADQLRAILAASQPGGAG